MHMVNDKGEAIYYNLVRKNNKDYWLVQGIGSTVVYGRDRERRKSRHFTQEQQAERYLARPGLPPLTMRPARWGPVNIGMTER